MPLVSVIVKLKGENGPNFDFEVHRHSVKSVTIRESNHGSGVCREHYALYYVPKSSIL